MRNVKKKGFTLIELIAVLVIMAIIALIATPLVMSIIRSARISADKRSIDAYGRSIELAIAGYLLDTGKFPTELSQLTIEYSGNKVECTTTQINPDSSVYLSNCKVNNREVSNYTYGSDKTPTYQAYSLGDTVTYNNIDFYVIKDSGAKDDTVTLLKAEPLTVAEVNLYGESHINRYTYDSPGSAYDQSGYGGVAYYTSNNCGYNDGQWNRDGCLTNYDQSEIKYIIDSWKNTNLIDRDINEVRLLTLDELLQDFKYEEKTLSCGGACTYIIYESNYIPDWLYNNSFEYWTMSKRDSVMYGVWYINNVGNIRLGTVDQSNLVLRPVVELYKSALN